MKVFDTYALYYDLLYKDKDYNGEADYIEKLIKQYSSEAKSILDLGCGTGRHDFIFAEKGYSVTGIEMSGKMIEAANKNLMPDKSNFPDLKFIQGDIRETELDSKFDVVLSLFHVMSYQTGNEDVRKTLDTAAKHLKPGGIFIFDFWYGPAVLTERPESRVKKLENDEITVERYAEPQLLINENIVDVKYKVHIKEKQNGRTSEINETHKMRYFFLPETRLMLEEYGMHPEHFEEWMTSKELSDKTWSALAVAIKK